LFDETPHEIRCRLWPGSGWIARCPCFPLFDALFSLSDLLVVDD